MSRIWRSSSSPTTARVPARRIRARSRGTAPDVLRIMWRFQRNGLIAMSAIGSVYGLVQAAAYFTAAGTTPAQRAALGRQVESLGRSISYLLPIPIRTDTVGGYMQWRI